jgi:alcohol dehydrogenase, propanol-preferring
MRAARIVEVNKPYELQTIPIPEPQGSDILVKVGAASFCHTDALALDGSWPVRKPCTGSHEGAGTIAKLGPKTPGHFKVGDRVGLHCFYHVCGISRISVPSLCIPFSKVCLSWVCLFPCIDIEILEIGLS